MYYIYLGFKIYGPKACAITSVELWSFEFGGPKNPYFCPKIKTLKGDCYILWIDLMPGPQNVPKLNFQSQFSCQKPMGFIL